VGGACPEAVPQVSRSASGVTPRVTQKTDTSVSGFFLRFAQSGTRPTPIQHFAPYETTSPQVPLAHHLDLQGRCGHLPRTKTCVVFLPAEADRKSTYSFRL
jgi:hypothetical protein